MRYNNNNNNNNNTAKLIIINNEQTSRLINQNENQTADFYGIYNTSSLNFFSPIPSDHKIKVHPSLHWENRAKELSIVSSTGTAIAQAFADEETWFIIPASWLKKI